MAVSGPPPDLTGLVENVYNAASSSGALIQTPIVETIQLLHPPYKLRFCPSLARKPVAQPSTATTTATPKVKSNPFLPPQRELHVASWPGYNIVLNKFPIIAEHFLLCTSTFEPQDEPLRPCDLEALDGVLHAWKNGRLFAFFNSGPHSGASQPHRHVQFLPLAEGARLWADECPTQANTGEEAWVSPEVPFVSYGVRLDGGTGLVKAYEALLQKVPEGGSYNLGVTKEWIVLLPRLEGGDGGVNGAVLGGEVVVRDQAVKGEGRMVVEKMLGGIGERNREYWGEGKGKL
ncbi:hypothetical protein EDC01DRAFT_646989 [Geopyxis carbonaria]|nr:hypothetical protein EDC01DRAFT_646989 [Geopyxis carbonaria]